MNAGRRHVLLALAAFLFVGVSVGVWTRAAAVRLAETSSQAPEVAMASASDMGYCTGELKVILRRVLTSCGLAAGPGKRGCQPLQARQVAAMSGGDFNALFLPLAERAAIIEFDKDSADLDLPAADLLEKTFSDRRGASYFFVVSRASPEGSVEHNRDLSKKWASCGWARSSRSSISNSVSGTARARPPLATARTSTVLPSLHGLIAGYEQGGGLRLARLARRLQGEPE
jgi:hypothetical protein